MPVWKPRCREGKRLAPSPTARECWSWGSNPSLSSADTLWLPPKTFQSQRSCSHFHQLSQKRPRTGRGLGRENELRAERVRSDGGQGCARPRLDVHVSGRTFPDCDQSPALRVSWPKGRNRWTKFLVQEQLSPGADNNKTGGKSLLYRVCLCFFFKHLSFQLSIHVYIRLPSYYPPIYPSIIHSSICHPCTYPLIQPTTHSSSIHPIIDLSSIHPPI